MSAYWNSATGNSCSLLAILCFSLGLLSHTQLIRATKSVLRTPLDVTNIVSRHTADLSLIQSVPLFLFVRSSAIHAASPGLASQVNHQHLTLYHSGLRALFYTHVLVKLTLRSIFTQLNQKLDSPSTVSAIQLTWYGSSKFQKYIHFSLNLFFWKVVRGDRKC